MTSLSRKAFRVITVLLVVCVLQVYVIASGTRPNLAKNVPTVSPALNGLVLGRLTLSADQSILVNGSRVNSGTTIFSGSQLQTPEGVEATVQLGSAGKLYLQPNTNLTVTFDNESVDVKVAAGNAFVAANAGVKSTLTTPDGKTSVVEPGNQPAPSPSKPWHEWTGGQKAALIIGIALAIFIPLCIWKCGGDDSPDR